MPDDFSRRVLISVDAEAYSARNDRQQLHMQHALLDVLEVAAAQAGFDRTRWDVQHAGDSELAVLPADTSERQVVDDFTGSLAHALGAHNDEHPDEPRLRLRMAVHQGLVCPSVAGYAGQGVVTVSRMVDSRPARRALLACPAADVVLALSPSLFVEVVGQGHTRLSWSDFREATIRNKSFVGTAWLHVPGHDLGGLPLDDEPSVLQPRAGSPDGDRWHPLSR
ncbi:hypothetical protein [Saccharothrix coeruleofusca]|uniref:Guanylate cyclase domain-containing protein n=1 Tax=Saccharothrix coeruleofusca TaxID=33919 RepID=A0A918AGH9_9PSEU|nr:hypothetical protein [Saccharothrix coeruleofusca]MBP2340539.1 hypothetical protein [Saccharothrix coeruleofusca]GGP34760.1 hypothetical protein GCM10010185_01810 [Saccharothrix coeruleofusca]